ncbi:putative leucine-rich repeat domain superfamily [Helianthus annuus]|nr:putative leucine-rich repeat domain superfamily [Helianthus annuus]
MNAFITIFNYIHFFWEKGHKILLRPRPPKWLSRPCPMLKTLKVNRNAWRFRAINFDEGSLVSYNEIAIAIGRNLLELRHLELIGNNMTNIGLQVILDNCRHLETLDLRNCCCINLKGDLGKQCSKHIKYLKRPIDSLKGCCPYYGIYGESSDEEYYDFGDNEDDYNFL